MISVLWHAVKRGQDAYTGKYMPKVLRYEKRKTGKGKGTQQPVWFYQDIDLSVTTVFAYNFFLTKSNTMYKKTVGRIQIRLKELEESNKDEISGGESIPDTPVHL
jgi:hypothetical protein